DDELDGGILLDRANQGLDRLARRGWTWHPERHRVPEKNLGERFADDGLDPAAANRLRRMLARGAAAEIRLHQHQPSGRIFWVRDRMIARSPAASLASIVLEQMVLESLEAHGFEKSRRNDAIGI